MVVISNNEVNFVTSALKSELRIDGRRLLDHRRIKISLGTDSGHAEVQLGNTRVLACVTAEVVKPFPDRPNEGVLTFNVNHSAIGMGVMEQQQQGADEAITLQRLLERAIKKTRSIDVEALCIIAGQHVWSIRVDVHMLDDGGNLTDCACMAAITALLHYRRPEVTIAGNVITVHSPEEYNPTPLIIHHIPVCVTVALFEDKDTEIYVVADPTHREQMIASAAITFVISCSHEPLLCGIHKGGGPAITPTLLYRLSNFAVTRAGELGKIVQASIDAFVQQEQLRNFGKAPPLPTDAVNIAGDKTIINDNVNIEGEVQQQDTTITVSSSSSSLNKTSDNVEMKDVGKSNSSNSNKNNWINENDGRAGGDDSNTAAAAATTKKKKEPKVSKVAAAENDDDDDDDGDLTKLITKKKKDKTKKK